jgi:hypothetical protein
VVESEGRGEMQNVQGEMGRGRKGASERESE